MTWSFGKSFHLFTLPLLACALGFLVGPIYVWLYQVHDAPRDLLSWIICVSAALVLSSSQLIPFLWLLPPRIHDQVSTPNDWPINIRKVETEVVPTSGSPDFLGYFARFQIVGLWAKLGSRMFDAAFHDGSIRSILFSLGLAGLFTVIWALCMARNPAPFESRLRWGLKEIFPKANV